MVAQKNIVADKFKNTSGVARFAYLADTFKNINIMNKGLQRKKYNIIVATEIVFRLKL